MRRRSAAAVLAAFFLAGALATGPLAAAAIDGEARRVGPDPRAPIGANLEVPRDWEVEAIASPVPVAASTTKGNGLYFVNMIPGWHITTGEGVLVHHPETAAAGNFSASAEIHVFEGRSSPIGLFFRGRALGTAARAAACFLIRASGDFLASFDCLGDLGGEWRMHEGIQTPAPGEGAKVNMLEIDVEAGTIRFRINGTEVERLETADPSDGRIGLYIGPGVDMHVSELAVALVK